MAIIASIYFFVSAAIVFNITNYESDDKSVEGMTRTKENVTVVVVPGGTKKTVITTVLDKQAVRL